jgi:eukaryotic-like serine/threonine-protein kinase
VSLLVDRYELGPTIGAGGMATVYAGHDRVLDRPVAIKLLGRYQQADARARLVREARAAARLHHPNVVAVHDTGEHDGQPFIVMELVQGRSLAEELRERGRLDIEEAVGIALGVLDGLAVAHAAGIVHRDVKPGNVLLPDGGGVKLTDFGIAKAVEDATGGLTATGTVLGTPNYLAPELISGAATAGPSSDVYGVGCVLYELLTGRPPFAGESSVAIAYAHVHQPAPDVTELRPEVPDDLASVVATAMRKDPAERYTDAAAMRTALLEGPSHAPAPSPSRTVVLPPPADTAPTEPLSTSTSASSPSSPRSPRWLVPVLVALLVAAGLWLLANATGLVGGDDPDTTTDATEPDNGEETEAPAGEVEPEETEPPEPTETEPTETEPTEPAPTETEPTETEPTETEPTETEPTEPGTEEGAPTDPAEPTDEGG